MSSTEGSALSEADTPNPGPGGGAVTSTGRARLVAAVARLKRPVVALAAVGTVLGGLAGYWNSYRTVSAGLAPASTDTALSAPAEKPPAAADRRMTFAVLPFTGPTGDAEATRLALAAFELAQAQQEARTNWARVAPRAGRTGDL